MEKKNGCILATNSLYLLVFQGITFTFLSYFGYFCFLTFYCGALLLLL